MQSPALSSLQSRDKSFTNRNQQNGFFQVRSIAEVVRSLFLSSILWLVLAMAIYGVYTIVLGSR